MPAHSEMGSIEVICGGMFSGKTEELIRRLRRAQIAKQRVMIFKPVIDDRYASDHIVSHNEQKLRSLPVKNAQEILANAGDAQVIGIDEGQFFDASLVQVCNLLAQRGVRVIVAGLDMDYRGVPFEPMPQLMAIAEQVTKTQAICMQCGEPASYTQRLTAARERVVVGATQIYEARCRKCFVPPES
ncbi:MAG: thymidine kinase [candidate division KSB1 bacterium]|nr:thymidine kinase [candidate division KSB1 bacterium]MDZ7274383.1 thymidine kinase [candidate division KSB1 bacterium]MDZ7284955.1 thymidine kinase [candidate division KSB1 bacterium]MDZ7297624.1 thymidine kinase [candidate division KSB1 bacterium]MDZ7306364.1 thymidine kinase [candidate division KSB1 bacterium]